MRRFLMLATITACLGLAGSGALAQDFPARQPIRIIVPWAPGGNVDITARTVAPALAQALGQTVVVENRPGAGGFIGTLYVAKSPPDGYTLILGSSGSISVGPALARKAPYDPTKDLVAIGPIHAVPMVLTSSARGTIQSYADFAARARGGNPVSIGSAGNGSSQHLALELLAQRAGLHLNHIPYKGAGPALNDLLGGQIDSTMDQLTPSLPRIRDGTILALAQTGKTRSPLLQDVPTFDELGVADFDMVTFTGLFVPAGISPPVMDKLTAALQQAMASPAVRERFAGLGVDIITLDRAAFQQYVIRDYANSVAIGKAANIIINE